MLCVPQFFVYALNVCKFSIWVARNDFRFRDVQPGAVAVLERPRFRFICHCFSAVSNPLRGAGILVGSGVPMVMLVQSVMAVCFYRFSSYSFTFLAFLFVCFPLLFAFGCWLPPLLPGPFVPSDSTPSVWWGVTQMAFFLCLCFGSSRGF